MRLLLNLIHFTVLMRVSTQAMLTQPSHHSHLLSSRSHLLLPIHSFNGSNLLTTQNSMPMSTPSKPNTVSSQASAHKTSRKSIFIVSKSDSLLSV